MTNEIAKKITDTLAQDLAKYKFRERHDNITGNIVGVVKKAWTPLYRGLGGHGISAVIVVKESVTDATELQAFFETIRKEINSQFVKPTAYKSSHSFIVLVCSHDLYRSCSNMAAQLKDKSGLHTNLIQGVVLVDSEMKEFAGDYTRPLQHKREYEAVLSAVNRAIK